jgi:glutamate-ammonia-ligase adenylyltransferase
MLISRPKYLEMLGWEGPGRKSLVRIRQEIRDSIEEGHPLNEAVRLVKQTEEIRLGLLFLRKKMDVLDVTRGLSRTAEAVLSACMGQSAEDMTDVAVIGFGKLGAREITFGSDLDLIFVSPEEVGLSDTRAAEKFLRLLISYTREGVAYRVDTRLRPEGSKGPLVSSIESFRKYYEKAAAFWEFQALLKARPVAGGMKAGSAFMAMAKETLVERGREISPSDIRQMRERIIRELSKEPEGYDIKLGPGGIEEVEFTAQYLQLVSCRDHERVLVQGTVTAIDRLKDAGVVEKKDAEFLREAYLFYRSLESFLRLRGENVLRRDEDTLKSAAGFMGSAGNGSFVESIEGKREKVQKIADRYLSGS